MPPDARQSSSPSAATRRADVEREADVERQWAQLRLQGQGRRGARVRARGAATRNAARGADDGG